MSGPKAADVRYKLSRAVETAQRLSDVAHKNAEKLGRLGAEDLEDSVNQVQALQRQILNETISNSITEYAPEEAAQLNTQRANIQMLINQGSDALRRAEELRNEAFALHQQAESLLGESVQLASSVSNRISGNYYGGFLYSEDADAAEARRKANSALDYEKQAGERIREALSFNKKAKNAFDTVITDTTRYQRSLLNSQTIATERETAARIAEENRRKATSFNAEINGVVESINALNHEKFASGEMSSFSSDLNLFRQSFSSGNFERANDIGADLVVKLRNFEQKVHSLQTAFEQAQISANNSLKAAQDETNLLDRGELIRWTDQESSISEAFAQINRARDLIDSEKFSDAESLINTAVAFLRAAAQNAETNKNGAEQRSYLADVIMNALYEQGYDAPTFYYARQNADGSDVEFSDLTIFAKAPGDKGDMRMNINLEGKVKLDVDGIAEGDETVCRQLIENLQKGVGDEIDFEMTDWGRAANANTQAKIANRQQIKEQTRTRERHGQ